MARFGVGVMHNTINSRFGPKPLVHADYAIGLACGADSFWVADHLNSVLPPSMWTPKHVGAARLIPKMDAQLKTWTILGYPACSQQARQDEARGCRHRDRSVHQGSACAEALRRAGQCR